MLRTNFFKRKINKLKNTNQKDWWKQMKHIVGMNNESDSSLKHLVNIETDGNFGHFAQKCNSFFQSISSHLTALTEDNKYTLIHENIPDKYTIYPDMVERNLMKLKLGKSPGPDCIPAWILRDFAPILCKPLAAIYNSSIRDGHVPHQWKMAFLSPIPKKNSPRSIEKDLRPISLTSIASKELERFVINWLREHNDTINDKTQFGNRKGCSTTHLLVAITHKWLEALDTGKNFIQTVFIDYQKAFDNINHNILLKKFEPCIPPFLLKWIASFICQRSQCVKIGDITSEFVKINGGIPQGTLFGMEGFDKMIADLEFLTSLFKFVDDSTATECIPLDDPTKSSLQQDLIHLQHWSRCNDMKVNPEKTKSMVISFTKKQLNLPSLILNDVPIEQVKSAKLVGVHISNDLRWQTQVNHMCSKASKRIFMLTHLRRSGASSEDLLHIYCAIIRPVLEYAAPVWSTSLTRQQVDQLESIQKRCIKIISPGKDQQEALHDLDLTTLEDRRTQLCKKFFLKIQQKDDIINDLLSENKQLHYNLRTQQPYKIPHANTERYKNSFIPYALRNYQF